MANILIVITSILIGLILQKVRNFPVEAPKALNAYLIYVVLPAVSLLHISKLNLGLELLLPVSVGWIIFTITWILFGYLGKRFGWDKKTIGCLIICGGLSNTGFIGYPVIEAIYGAEGLKIAVLIDQTGSFLVVSSLAIIVASLYGSEKMRKRDISKQMLLFPPFLFFILALLLNIFQIEIRGVVQKVLESFSATLTPIALIAVGLQIKIKVSDIKDNYLWYGLAHKLVLIPTLIYAIYHWIPAENPDQNLIFKVSVMEAAMASMITSSIIATNYNLRPKLASLLVGVGIPLSVITLTFWYYLLEYFR
ncbi:AEC family transporter [Cyclobacterium sp. 1_MG-2023]|uniref:AEC family transporter n=1 Tax=Cyclobacterium sp. 1_MG-2023 TaxID=3062681 RepID=UPI0026E213E5|nr:AEC family transporter [Cyclobacterium sp. 1_MG-2023]MDO6437703.1 AEC family transporter [Cyclobacterium sp. 1_MG-2023]